MELIAHHVHVSVAPGKVVEAVTTAAGFRGWWTDCDMGRVGEEAVFRFDPPREVVFLIDRIDTRGIEMTCIRNTNQEDWQGTHLSLRAVAQGEGTYVDLLHDGYPAKNAFYEKCVAGWAHYLGSLRAYCETGRGLPWGTARRASSGHMDVLGFTSRWVAAARARETERPDRLFADPLAAALAGDEGRAFFEEMEQLTAIPGRPADSPYIPIRTGFLDDAFLEAARAGTRQFVILAAGMDARAFRLDWPEGTTVYEIERQEVLAHKEAVLEREGAKPRARRVVIACDLREDWPARLRDAGYDPERPAGFLVEGLVVYLPDEAAALRILGDAAKIAANGSVVGLDITGRSFLESPWTKSYRDALAARGVEWRYGTDEPEELLARAGWPESRVVQPHEAGIADARWPYPAPPRGVAGVPRSYLVVARR
jgi:methyltransferase (TIGR00027 family)